MEPPEDHAGRREPPEDHADRREPPEDHADRREPPEGRADRREPLEGHAGRREPPEGRADRREPPEGRADRREPLEGHADRREPPEGHADRREPPEGRADRREPGPGPDRPEGAAPAEAAALPGSPQWRDGREAPVLVFTDGAASKNGQVGATAGYSAVLVGGPFGDSLAACTVLFGPVAPRGYALADPLDPARGCCLTEAPVPPSNNRGELLGVVYGLLGLLAAGARRAELFSDSQITVRTLNEWLPARKRRRTEGQLANYDLVSIADRALGALRAAGAEVALTHVRGHQRDPGPSDPRARSLWAGNGLADRHARGPARAPCPAGRAGDAAPVSALRGPPALRRVTRN